MDVVLQDRESILVLNSSEVRLLLIVDMCRHFAVAIILNSRNAYELPFLNLQSHWHY